MEPTDISIDAALASGLKGLSLSGDSTPSPEVESSEGFRPGAPAEDTPASGEPETVATEEPVEEPSLEVDGVKLTASEIKALKAQASKADDLERKYNEATTDSERMRVWKQMDDLAQKYPALRDKLVGVFSEFEKEASPDQPIDNRSDDQKVRDQQIDALLQEAQERKVAEAGTEIDTFVKDYAERFPEIVKFDDAWMGGPLLETVVDLYGQNANIGPKQIQAALDHLVVKNGALTKSAENGAKKLAERLAQEPPGTRIVKGGAPRSAAEAPPVSIKGKDVDDTLLKGFRSMAGKLLTG